MVSHSVLVCLFKSTFHHINALRSASLCTSYSGCRPLLPSFPDEPLWQDKNRPSRVFESLSGLFPHSREHVPSLREPQVWLALCVCMSSASIGMSFCQSTTLCIRQRRRSHSRLHRCVASWLYREWSMASILTTRSTWKQQWSRWRN